MVEIKELNSSLTLLFFERGKEGYFVEIKDGKCFAKQFVYDYTSSPMSFFKEIAKEWKGWGSDKVYESIEGQLKLKANHDGKGHITLEVILSPANNVNVWELKHFITLEVAQLDEIANQMDYFFNGAKGKGIKNE